MYFQNRAAAGKLLAEKLMHYRSEHIVVVALGVGSSVVAAQVAMRLHANVLLYAIRNINLPGEMDPLAGIGSGDIFTFSHQFSTGQIEEMTSEYHSYIDQQRLEQRHEMHVLLGEHGEINKALLRHRIVIVVADGLASGFSLDVINDFLKTIAIERLVIAVPVASFAAVDRMHLLGDEIYCLSVTDNYMGADHYYDDTFVPSVPDVLKMMRNIAINWDQSSHKSA